MKQISTLIMILISFVSQAQTYTWTGALSGDWNREENWIKPAPSLPYLASNPIPTGCSDVIIPQVASNRYPSLINDVFTNGLEFNGGYINTNDKNLSIYNALAPIQYVPVKSGTAYQFSYGQEYGAQNVSIETSGPKSYTLRRSISTCAPIYRFELHPGDYWLGDSTNMQNDTIKERTELSLRNSNYHFNDTIWVSYSIYIEPGDSVIYHNPDFYCTVGQWHTQANPDGASWEFEFIGERMNLKTKGGSASYSTDRANVALSRGVWHNIVVRTFHNPSATLGHITWWLDGLQKYSGHVPLGTNTDSAVNKAGYWKFGIYRTPADPGDRVELKAIYANVEINTSSLRSRVLNPLPRN